MSTRKTLLQKIANLENERATLEQGWRVSFARYLANLPRPSHVYVGESTAPGYHSYANDDAILRGRIRALQTKLKELPE